MFNDALIGKMKRGAYIVNTARGKICDRDAIVRALEERPTGRLRGRRLVPAAAAEGPSLADDAAPRHDAAHFGHVALGPGPLCRRHARNPGMLVREAADPRRVPDRRRRQAGRRRRSFLHAPATPPAARTKRRSSRARPPRERSKHARVVRHEHRSAGSLSSAKGSRPFFICRPRNVVGDWLRARKANFRRAALRRGACPPSSLTVVGLAPGHRRSVLRQQVVDDRFQSVEPRSLRADNPGLIHNDGQRKRMRVVAVGDRALAHRGGRVVPIRPVGPILFGCFAPHADCRRRSPPPAQRAGLRDARAAPAPAEYRPRRHRTRKPKRRSPPPCPDSPTASAACRPDRSRRSRAGLPSTM